MSAPLTLSGLLLLAGTLAVAADPAAAGRLTTGCVDRTVSPEFCKWVARYQPEGSRGAARGARSEEQRAIEAAIGDLTVVQPAQIQGTRASILVQRNGGDFAVAMLEKRDGRWSISSVGEPTPAKR